MEYSMFQPFVRTVGLSPIIFENMSASIAPDARIFYIYKGNGKITLHKKETHEISKDDLFVIPPGVFYDFQCFGEPIHIFSVDFDFTLDYSHLKSYISIMHEHDYSPDSVLKTEIPEPFNKVIYLKNMKLAKAKLLNMLQEFLLKNRYSSDKVSLILKDILIDVARTVNNTKVQFSETIATLLNHIHTHYSDDINYDILSEQFSYHPYHLNRLFKEETGKTISQYLLDYRLHIAAQMILCSGFSVEEIAYSTGFKNSSHFSTRFKKKYGEPPKEYKRHCHLIN